MQRIAEFAVMTVCGTRGPSHQERQCCTASSMVTASNGRPSSSARCVKPTRASPSRDDRSLGCLPQRGALAVDLPRGCGLSPDETGVLIPAQEAAELRIG